MQQEDFGGGANKNDSWSDSGITGWHRIYVSSADWSESVMTSCCWRAVKGPEEYARSQTGQATAPAVGTPGMGALQCKDYGYQENCDKSFAWAIIQKAFTVWIFCLFFSCGQGRGWANSLGFVFYSRSCVKHKSGVVCLKILWQVFRLPLAQDRTA